LVLPEQLHRQGKTTQANTDLARLVEVRENREVALAKQMALAEGQLLLGLSLSSLILCSTAKAKEIEEKTKACMERRFQLSKKKCQVFK